MKDIESIIEQAKKGDQSAFDYLCDNNLGVFNPETENKEKMHFLEECIDAGIDIHEEKLSDEALIIFAKDGCQWAYDSLIDRCWMFGIPLDDDAILDFFDECNKSGIVIEYNSVNYETLELLAKHGNQCAFDTLVEEGEGIMEYPWDGNDEWLEFIFKCEENGVDINLCDEWIDEQLEYGDEDLADSLASLKAYTYLDKDNLSSYEWVKDYLENNNEVARIASKHLEKIFNYKEDIQWLKEQADDKIPQAQFLLGVLYWGEGNIIDQNESLALRYLKAAKESGCNLAEEHLAKIEHNQEEERQKREAEQERIKSEKEQAKKHAKELAQKATELIERAEKGELTINELLTLATDLALGDASKGIKKNANKATKFYRMAAEQGCAEAQCQMGIRMIEGTGCRKNWNAGIKWLKKSLKGGYEPAKTYLSEYDTLFNRMLHKFIK